jgi:hypothetical protein
MSFSTGDNAQTFWVSGSGTNGVLIQQASCGTMTALLTGAPSLTYWRFRYLQYTNFAMLSIVSPFQGQVAFGSTSTLNIPKAGELLYFAYIVMQIPGIIPCPPRAGGCGPTQQFPYAIDSNNPCAPTESEYFASIDGGYATWSQENYGGYGNYEEDCALNACGSGVGGACDTDPWCHWVNAFGQFVLKRVLFQIGQQVIDCLYNDFLFMWEELSGKPGKRLGEMVGKYQCREDLIAFSSQTRNLYVPLPFYFTLTPGNALPIVSIMFAQPNLVVTFEQLQNCVVVSGPNVQVLKANGTGVLGNNDLQAAFDGTQVFLDILERDRFASTWFEQLITQTFALYTNICCSTARLQLGFGFTVIELIWAVRRRCQERANNWFNYSGIAGKDPVVAAGLLFNSVERQSMRNGTWYRLVQPYQFHSLIPDAFIYDYSFSLYPEEAQPAGGANFARLESATLVIELQDGLGGEDVTIIVFSRSYNLIKYRDGSASLVLG